MLEKIASIVREAGRIVLSAHDIGAQTHEKTSAGDLVTDYDLAVETFLKEKLPPLAPGSIFFGEEEAENADPSRGWAFIVDPIDGTANFVRQLRQSAISVALALVQYRSNVTFIAQLMGVSWGALAGAFLAPFLYGPYRDEIFTAKRGGGAFLNSRPIHVSDRPLSEGIFGMGTALYKREYIAPTLRLTEQLFRRSCDFRRMGAAALDLCYVACGRFDAHHRGRGLRLHPGGGTPAHHPAQHPLGQQRREQGRPPGSGRPHLKHPRERRPPCLSKPSCWT